MAGLAARARHLQQRLLRPALFLRRAADLPREGLRGPPDSRGDPALAGGGHAAQQGAGGGGWKSGGFWT